MFGSQLMRNETAEHVDLVCFRDRDQQVNLRHAERFEKSIGCAVANTSDQVHLGTELVNDRFVLIDNRNLMPFLQKLRSDG